VPYWAATPLYSAAVVSSCFPRLSSVVADCLPYFHTSCGLRENLECRSEMCCTWLAENTGRKKSPYAHHRTTLSGYIFATKACMPIDNRKKLLNSNISSTCRHNMANFDVRPTNNPRLNELHSGWRYSSTAACMAQHPTTYLDNCSESLMSARGGDFVPRRPLHWSFYGLFETPSVTGLSLLPRLQFGTAFRKQSVLQHLWPCSESH